MQQNFENHKVAKAKTLRDKGALDVVHNRAISPSQNQPEPWSRNAVFVLCRHLRSLNSYDIRYLDIEIRFKIISLVNLAPLQVTDHKCFLAGACKFALLGRDPEI